MPLLSIKSVTFYLNLNAALLPRKLTAAPALVKVGLSLYYCHKLPDVFELLSLYSIKLYISITTSVSLTLSISVLFNSFMQSVN